MLNRSGLDTSRFTAHSTRHASTSAAARKGVSYDTIRLAAGWTRRSSTFANFYDRPIIEDNDFANRKTEARYGRTETAGRARRECFRCFKCVRLDDRQKYYMLLFTSTRPHIIQIELHLSLEFSSTSLLMTTFCCSINSSSFILTALNTTDVIFSINSLEFKAWAIAVVTASPEHTFTRLLCVNHSNLAFRLQLLHKDSNKRKQ
ncbi:hypothetical protein NQ317_018813 [Molorchus minor]|uniref:Tyr recombinase domain-containing protein n=1 Tax=Molorchus minor TaxID=1323400 RepID=A0ABQ9JQ70_9CUCU|nr:hypothetical protein NQ317_018813 [Molorchus minor]